MELPAVVNAYILLLRTICMTTHSVIIAYRENREHPPKVVERKAKMLGLNVEFHMPFMSFASHEEPPSRMSLTKPVWLVHFKMRNPKERNPMPDVSNLHRRHQLFYIGMGGVIAEIDREKIGAKQLPAYLSKLAESGLEYNEVTEAQVPNGKRFDAMVLRLSGPKDTLEDPLLHKKLGVELQGLIHEKRTNIRPGFEGN